MKIQIVKSKFKSKKCKKKIYNFKRKRDKKTLNRHDVCYLTLFT